MYLCLCAGACTVEFIFCEKLMMSNDLSQLAANQSLLALTVNACALVPGRNTHLILLTSMQPNAIANVLVLQPRDLQAVDNWRKGIK